MNALDYNCSMNDPALQGYREYLFSPWHPGAQVPPFLLGL
jgi:hypothetical protein